MNSNRYWRVEMPNNDKDTRECAIRGGRDVKTKERFAHTGLRSCQICQQSLHCCIYNSKGDTGISGTAGFWKFSALFVHWTMQRHGLSYYCVTGPLRGECSCGRWHRWFPDKKRQAIQKVNRVLLTAWQSLLTKQLNNCWNWEALVIMWLY